MRIRNHRLIDDRGEQVPYRRSPNCGGVMQPRFLVLHFTAGRDFSSSVNWLTDERARASAHLVIGRDGAITQLVPFNRVAWHAGRSEWAGISGLNGHSIGIELDNAGGLERHADGWRTWFGARIDDEEITEAVHKHGGPLRGWHRFPEAQLTAALEAALSVVAHYRLEDVVGHDDISPGRKTDPGPAFPMGSFRARLLGRVDEEEPVWTTTARLNVRTGAGTEHAVIDGSPLPVGTRVAVVEEAGVWKRADVLDTVAGINDLHGWMHGRYLTRAVP